MSELDETELVDWRQLPPGQRRGWWEQLWEGAIALAARYRLALRSGWWEDSLQVEALAAFYGWLRLYDTGAYTDPPGKLQLLWELERLRALLRAGDQAFDPARDRPAFETHLDSIDQPKLEPPKPSDGHQAEDSQPARRRRVADELTAVSQRLAELRERKAILNAGPNHVELRRTGSLGQAEQDLAELERTVRQLARREGELRRQLDDHPGG